MFFDQTFKIFFDDGNVVETDNLLSWIKTNFEGTVEIFYYRMKWVCKYEKEPFWQHGYYNKWDISFYSNTFYLYTKNNVMVSPELFKNEYKSRSNRDFWDRIEKRNREWLYRPWRKSHSTTYDRKMETIAERRAVAGVVKEEGEPEFRGKRRNIPNPWDDIMARRSLSWKDCTKRKRQHKGS